MLQGGDQRIEIGLAGHAAHAGDGGIGDIHIRVASPKNASGIDAAGVVRVEMDRNVHFLPQRLDQGVRRIRPAQTRHVLDRQNVRSHPHQFLGHLHVIFQAVFASVGIENIAGVTDCGFADCVGFFPDGVHRDRHIFGPVQRIENAEDVDAVLGRTNDKLANDVVGIIGVTNGIAGAQKHLKKNVGHFFAQLVEPIPRVFLKKSHGRVEGRPAPHFQAEKLRREVRGRARRW